MKRLLVMLPVWSAGIGAAQSTVEPWADAAAAVPAYSEPHRPQFHFTPPSMWMNDPNGLVHWEHLPIALAPDARGYIFSGSAVVDWHNTGGFGVNGKPPLIAIYTCHDPVRGKAGTGDHESQGLTYSNDRGRTWTKYDGNPVLPNVSRHKDFRDPKVFWHEPSQHWIMALSVFDHVQFHGSADLKRWQLLGTFGQGKGAHDGNWECPDLFPLRVALDVARVQPGLVQVGQQAVASLITSDKRRQADGCNETGKSQRHIQRRTAGVRTSQRASPKHRIARVWLVAGGVTAGLADTRQCSQKTRLYCNKVILQRKERHHRRNQLQQGMMNSIAFLAQWVCI